MALDSGELILSVPANAPAIAQVANVTPETLGGVLLTTIQVKGGVQIFDNVDLVEVGLLVTVATAANLTTFTVDRAPATGTGASFTTLTTVTSPLIIIPVGVTLLKRGLNIRLNKGDCVRFNMTVAPTAGQGFFYLKCYPAGASGSTQADEILSTT